jgi:methylglutaconyl-CoA hydratase
MTDFPTSEYIVRDCPSEGVARITLNRPEVHNAMNEHMIGQLIEEFSILRHDPMTRVVILAATGKSFCAGADLTGMQRAATASIEENIEDAKRLAHLLDMIDTCPKPVIALIQGPAYGGGVGLVAACDIAVCSDETFFCLTEVKWGLIPAVISPFVINAIGQRHARRYVLTAERIVSNEAMRLGLVHQVVPTAELEATGEALIANILRASPEALQASKELIRYVESRPIDESVHNETARRIAVMRASTLGREGIRAFLEKRTPSWVKEQEA